ncbi:MAG TPA: thioredoxin domain-containing protein [Chroococcales cyanobacterium]|jgi:thiol-disulfide isomerase/thioredoxin
MNSTQPKLRLPLLVGALFFFFSTAFFLSPLSAAAMPLSLTGIASLRDMAQQSMPYENALRNGLPTLIEFYADWCTSCQSLAPTINYFHQQYGSQVNFVMLNVDDPQWSQQVQQYQVAGVPQFFFMRSDRTVMKTLVGRVPDSILAQLFKQLVN